MFDGILFLKKLKHLAVTYMMIADGYEEISWDISLRAKSHLKQTAHPIITPWLFSVFNEGVIHDLFYANILPSLQIELGICLTFFDSKYVYYIVLKSQSRIL